MVALPLHNYTGRYTASRIVKKPTADDKPADPNEIEWARVERVLDRVSRERRKPTYRFPSDVPDEELGSVVRFLLTMRLEARHRWMRGVDLEADALLKKLVAKPPGRQPDLSPGARISKLVRGIPGRSKSDTEAIRIGLQVALIAHAAVREEQRRTRAMQWVDGDGYRLKIQAQKSAAVEGCLRWAKQHYPSTTDEELAKLKSELDEYLGHLLRSKQNPRGLENLLKRPTPTAVSRALRLQDPSTLRRQRRR